MKRPFEFLRNSFGNRTIGPAHRFIVPLTLPYEIPLCDIATRYYEASILFSSLRSRKLNLTIKESNEDTNYPYSRISFWLPEDSQNESIRDLCNPLSPFLVLFLYFCFFYFSFCFFFILNVLFYFIRLFVYSFVCLFILFLFFHSRTREISLRNCSPAG